MSPTPAVVVGVATFRRNAELLRMLPVVVDQARSLQGANARVVVVDNDPDAGAREAVTSSGLDVAYEHEPEPGIAASRNRAVDVARASEADAVVFIDDDEIPDPGWLQALVDAWQRFGCVGVTGPVVYEPAVPMEDFARVSRLFDRIEHATGTVIHDAATNNLILDLGVLARLGVRFDQEFGLTGGSDSMLSQTLIAAGEEFRWCDEAVVREIVPASRLTSTWVQNRIIRTSNTWTRVVLETAESPSARARTYGEYAARGVWRLARGSVTRGVGRVRNDEAKAAGGAIDVASGRGILLAIAGHRHVEYKRT